MDVRFKLGSEKYPCVEIFNVIPNPKVAFSCCQMHGRKLLIFLLIMFSLVFMKDYTQAALKAD